MLLKTKSSFLLTCCLLLALAITFQACTEQDPITPQDQKAEQSIFKKHLADQTQIIQAEDIGEGQYSVTGEQGTIIEINNALVNAAGNRVRGAVEIKLIEIYTVSDMILNRKQTLADYDGNLALLESGGEVFVKVYQNGEELNIDGQGTMSILLPTENTGGVKEGMELFYGEEVGAQIIWKPTGEKLQVIDNDLLREEGSYYMMMLQNTLGWLNADVMRELGEPIECVEVIIECELCEMNLENTVVAANVASVNSGFELNYQGNNTFRVCGNENGNMAALGGVNVTFIVIIECMDGTLFTAFVNVTLNAGNHTEIINCEQLQETNAEELEGIISALN